MPSAEASISALSLADSGPSPRLPFDVLNLIIGETVRVSTLQTAGRFCLINKSLLATAQRGLYKCLPISYTLKTQETEDNTTLVGVWSDDALPRRTLKDAPQLGQHVRMVHLIVNFGEHYTEGDLLQIQKSLQEIVAACPNVAKLVIEDHGMVEVPDNVAAVLSRSSWVDTLRNVQIDYTGEGAVALLSKLRQLQFLAISSLNSYGELEHSDSPPAIPESFPFSLTELDFRLYTPQIFTSLVHNSLSTLTSLVIPDHVLIDLEVLKAVPAMVNLRSLQLDPWEVTNVQDTRAIASAISSLPNLESLTLWVFGTTPEAHPLPAILFPRLPQSLQRLDISDIKYHPTTLIKLFDHRKITPPPRLKEIVLGRDVLAAMRGDIAEERLWWSTAVECCAVRGVAVLVGR